MGAYALALVAGFISFSSPCCLPLMPGYASYVSGVAGSTEGGLLLKRRLLGAGTLFVLGFALVFTAMGASATLVGSALLSHRTGLIQIAGVLVIALGLVSVGVLRVPFLLREFRPGMRSFRPGPAGALPLGMAFAIGWTPCIGPVLAGILTAAASTGAPLQGATLLFTYSLGLGIPFLLLAVGVGRSARLASWLGRRGRQIELVGGVLLVTIGTLMVTGLWLRVFIPALRLFSRTGWPPI